jgi:hypothetical protein
MKLKGSARRIWRSVEALAYAVEYDPQMELHLRVERLERLVADLNARMPA